MSILLRDEAKERENSSPPLLVPALRLLLVDLKRVKSSSRPV